MRPRKPVNRTVVRPLGTTTIRRPGTVVDKTELHMRPETVIVKHDRNVRIVNVRKRGNRPVSETTRFER